MGKDGRLVIESVRTIVQDIEEVRSRPWSLGLSLVNSYGASGSCPSPWCNCGGLSPRSPAWPDWSASHDWQADDGIIAQRRDRFQGHVAAALDGPFVVLFRAGSGRPGDAERVDLSAGAEEDIA